MIYERPGLGIIYKAHFWRVEESCNDQPLHDFKYTIMNASIIIKGILHKVVINTYSNKRKTARIHKVTNEPVTVLTEVGNNKFIDTVENKVYQLNPMTRVLIGV